MDREWLALKDWEEVTKAPRLNMLQRVVFPKIGGLPVKRMTLVHALDVLNATSVRGRSKEAAFLLWLMECEWNRLSSGAGYVDHS
ncbi:hypothetical protein D3871_03295 [Noviherbaspirillum saxi]|uniref:Phage integrase central domain-containing protein n=2 Tax=Noviherbaspirillum saxi TaxID=2320863 RepID=A0A3A3FNS5_9BURK|nr:hypothetical protein D3871_03295 [Noviherbaspirillum saxi]